MQSIENKTIAEWYEEVRGQARDFTEKYERCFHNRRYTTEMTAFYRHTRDTYFAISGVLMHLQNYGKLIDDDHCLSCQFEQTHRDKIVADFCRFQSLIVRCSDGGRYRGINETDTKVQPSS